MSVITRRTLLHSGAILAGSIVLPVQKRITAGERYRLTSAMGENIGGTWKMFHTANTTYLLAVGKAQLDILRQCHEELNPNIRSGLYSAVYRLIGATLYFGEHYTEAYQASTHAYTAALEGNDVWNMAQSLSWQAIILNALNKLPDALQTADMALRTIAQRNSIESMILRGRLYASSAENEAVLRNTKASVKRLFASEKMLEYIPKHHEEFDSASWYQYMGLCALHTKQYRKAADYLHQALDETPPQWLLRQAHILISLATTYVYLHELDASLEIASKASPIVEAIGSKRIDQQLLRYFRQDLANTFPNEAKVTLFLAAQDKL